MMRRILTKKKMPFNNLKKRFNYFKLYNIYSMIDYYFFKRVLFLQK